MYCFFVAEAAKKDSKNYPSTLLSAARVRVKRVFWKLSFGVDPISQQKGSLVENCRRQKLGS